MKKTRFTALPVMALLLACQGPRSEPGQGLVAPAGMTVLEGKALPQVPGPLTGTQPLLDRSFNPGDSRIDLAMRAAARRGGATPGVQVPAGDVAIRHGVALPAGWMAYRVEAAPGERIQARLRTTHEGWFKVSVVNKFGEMEEGMLHNLIPTGNPEASYQNPRKDTATVYFVVDTTTQLNGSEPYLLLITREPGAR